MADRKYGRIFTEADVYHMFFTIGIGQEEASSIIDDTKTKFPPDEPVFVLRGQDRRALGAIHFYRDHQAHDARTFHLEGIDKAVADFEKFRRDNLDKMKDPN